MPDTPDVERVLFGDDGIASSAAEKINGLIVVDHSTICPVATRRFAERLADSGVALVDAPVSGGDVGAREGTLSIMCGGDREPFQRVRPLLEVVGKSVTHLGPAGSGQACKACNQIAGAAALAGACEALALAKANGLDLRQVVDVVSAGAAGSWQLANLGPKIAAGDHAPGFMVDLMLKDLRLVAGAADENGLRLPVSSLVETLLRATSEAGDGSQGTQALASEYERLGDFSFAAKASSED